MTDQQPKKRALGKGLSALLTTKLSDLTSDASVQTSTPRMLPLEQIEPNPLQPRTIFQQAALDELAQSIRANGIIQPLIVRKKDGRTQLVAGERRLRAAKLAGLAVAPVVFTEIDDNRLLEVTLIENIQREDLNPLEVAEAYQHLMVDLGLTHEQIAERTGKDRSTITNHLRLLRLPPAIQQLVADRRLSMGHARALVAVPDTDDQLALANKAAAESLSVREMERLARQHSTLKKNRQPDQRGQDLDPNWKAAIADLQRVLGTKVSVQLGARGSGKLEIEFYSPQDLERIYEILIGTGDSV
ncbi:MAG: ParB/RepB/Spo0J family partition protein [Bryobacterales bacterium]|nr:ParB/RepB/Spo0J family partition protein [Bryobacterales bacterium]